VFQSARRYLADRYMELTNRYAELPHSGRSSDGYHYTEDARSIFPRYNAVDAISVEVDRLDPRVLPSPNEIVEWLLTAADAADSMFTKDVDDEVQQEAARDERGRFARFIESLPDRLEHRVDTVPFRRTLDVGEGREWRERLTESWPLEHGGFWGPLNADYADGRDHLALTSDAFWSDSGRDGPASVAMRDALRVLGVEWVFEVREYGSDFERHAETVAMVYTGAEGLFTSERLDWIVFASHEQVTTVGGVIVPAVKDAWTNWQSSVWTGWT
jgi:hypothetical protein